MGASVALWGALWGALKGTAPPSAPPPLRDTTTTSTPVRIQPLQDANVHLLPGKMRIGGSDGGFSGIERGESRCAGGANHTAGGALRGPDTDEMRPGLCLGLVPVLRQRAAGSGRRRGGGDGSPRYLRYLVAKVSGALGRRVNRQRYFARARKRSNSQGTDDESQDPRPLAVSNLNRLADSIVGLMNGFPAALTSSRTGVQYEGGPCVNRCMRHVRARQYLTLVLRTSPPHRPSSSSPSRRVSPKRSPLSRQVKSRAPAPRVSSRQTPVVDSQQSTVNRNKKKCFQGSPMPVAEPEFTSALLYTADKLLIRTGNSSNNVGVERYALTECQSTDASKAPASTPPPARLHSDTT